MVDPPLEDGAVHEMVAAPSEPVALRIVGAPGSASGVTVVVPAELDPTDEVATTATA